MNYRQYEIVDIVKEFFDRNNIQYQQDFFGITKKDLSSLLTGQVS